MTALAIPPKIALLIPLLGSAVDGEVLGAARAIGRTLGAAGQDFHDFARAVLPLTTTDQDRAPARGDWRADLHLAVAHINRLTEREQTFVANLASSARWREPSAKQQAWLSNIALRLRRAAA
jgi:hypothetical protein